MGMLNGILYVNVCEFECGGEHTRWPVHREFTNNHPPKIFQLPHLPITNVMLSYILLAVGIYVLYKTNPSDDSFTSFLADASRKNNTNKGFFQRITDSLLPSRTPSRRQFVISDYVFFKTAFVHDTKATYLGILNHWIFVQGYVGDNSTSLRSNSSDSRALQEREDALEKEAESWLETGHKLRAKAEYKKSADAYIKAGEIFNSMQTPPSPLTVAECYENAYKSLSSLLSQSSSSNPPSTTILNDCKSMLRKCIQILESNNKSYSKAARMYETLSSLEMRSGNIISATQALQKAVEVYDYLGDRRSITTTIQICDMLASNKSYAEAQGRLGGVIAKESMSTDALLKYSMNGYCLNYVLLGIGAVVITNKKNNDVVGTRKLVSGNLNQGIQDAQRWSPGFLHATSKESRVIEKLREALEKDVTQAEFATKLDLIVREGNLTPGSWQYVVLGDVGKACFSDASDIL